MNNRTFKDILSLNSSRFIYKYYTNEHNRLQDVIINKTIWFSSPSEFNDPYDCRLVVNTKNNKRQVKEFANYLCKKLNKTEVERLDFTSKFLNSELRYKVINDSIQESVSKSGVACFSKNRDSILMWSHYSNSHKGYCVKFDIAKDVTFFKDPVIVKYVTKYPRFNQIRNWDILFPFIFGVKYAGWSYEEEMRLIKDEQGNIGFNPEAIVGVTFGIDCVRKDIELIKNQCQDNGYKNIVFERAMRKPQKFGLVYQTI